MSLLLVSACTDEPAQKHDGLLEGADVPTVRTTDTFDRGASLIGGCGRFTATESVLANTVSGRLFTLESGDQVSSALLEVGRTRPTAQQVLDDVASMVESCVAWSDDHDEVTVLDKLPDGAVGYRSVIDTSNGPRTVERAYARVDDKHLVVVAGQHTGDGDLTVSVADLLPRALDRVRKN